MVKEPSGEAAVVLTVPATADQLSLLRSLVSFYAGRERFTIDQIDDLRMAVDEAGVQLLRQVTGDIVRMELQRAAAGVVVRLSADVDWEGPVIDPASFSWTILKALADEFDVERDGAEATIVLAKHALAGLGRQPTDTAAGETNTG